MFPDFFLTVCTCVGMTWSRISNQGGPDCCFPHLSIPVYLLPLSEATGDSSSVCVDDSYARIYEHLSYHFSFYTVELYMFVFCRCGSRIWSRGGPELLRPKVADVASILRPGSRARLRALEAFGFLMLKYAFSQILETLFLLFKTSILTPKVDKNRALDFTSINLKHSHMLHLFFNLHEKLCFN